jgi:hypothetical protein
VAKASKLPADLEELKVNSDPKKDIFSTFLPETVSNVCVLRATALLFLLDFCHACIVAIKFLQVLNSIKGDF